MKGDKNYPVYYDLLCELICYSHLLSMIGHISAFFDLATA